MTSAPPRDIYPDLSSISLRGSAGASPSRSACYAAQASC